eukprot:CAMPEP_0206013858 /NCGR_PEP_ID=MMETSP1464-20131121/17218_1 /ASSEMBLY_ACC=CAM_ASM_001124 /TAXON_ID=119497 /ORGANISM="Exanthemachrysis gayraliae, Strain RCC1523" /LENGTH=67 /DNA_ID=CAMNT_0053387597 /DNA_START=140 /DNA_END=340 /DNA_ORIENTATION=+
MSPSVRAASRPRPTAATALTRGPPLPTAKPTPKPGRTPTAARTGGGRGSRAAGVPGADGASACPARA